MKQIKSLTAITLSLVVILASCNSDDEITPVYPAPELPPVESMEMNFSNFNDDNSGGRMESDQNWSRAALHVGVWNTILVLNLAVPVASFKVAVTQSPSYDADRELWVWRFDHTVLGRTYSFELTGKLVSDTVEWNMYASEENGFQNVLWYTGEMQVDGSSGYWLLNRDGDNPTTYLRADWEKSGDGIGTIRYTSVETGAELEDSYIEYSQTNNSDFNRSYDIYIDKDDNRVEIDWHHENGNGRIKNPRFYGDDNFRCWDTDFQDVDC